MGSHKISTLSRRAEADRRDDGPSGITSKGESAATNESARDVLSEGVEGGTGSEGVKGVEGGTDSEGIKGVDGETGSEGIKGVEGGTCPEGVKGVEEETSPEGVKEEGFGAPKDGTEGQTVIKITAAKNIFVSSINLGTNNVIFVG